MTLSSSRAMVQRNGHYDKVVATCVTIWWATGKSGRLRTSPQSRRLLLSSPKNVTIIIDGAWPIFHFSS